MQVHFFKPISQFSSRYRQFVRPPNMRYFHLLLLAASRALAVPQVGVLSTATSGTTAIPVPLDISQVPVISEPNVVILFELFRDHFENFRAGLGTQTIFGRSALSATIVNSTTFNPGFVKCETFDEEGVSFEPRNVIFGNLDGRTDRRSGFATREGKDGGVIIGSFVCRLR